MFFWDTGASSLAASASLSGVLRKLGLLPRGSFPVVLVTMQIPKPGPVLLGQHIWGWGPGIQLPTDG